MADSKKGRFRTPSGQTGKDAYVYELARLANKLDALEREAARVMQAIAEDLPDTASLPVSIASEPFPDAFITIDAEHIRIRLTLTGLSMLHERADEFLKLEGAGE